FHSAGASKAARQTSVAAKWDARAAACPCEAIAVSVMGPRRRGHSGLRSGSRLSYWIEPDPAMNKTRTHQRSLADAGASATDFVAVLFLHGTRQRMLAS